MLKNLVLSSAILLCGLLLNSDSTSAKRTFGSSARDYYARAAAHARPAHRNVVEKREDTSSFRFYNDKSSKYLVDHLPLMPFDIGEMYSGQIPVNTSDPSRVMFFVFQPRVNGPPVDEVTIWFNGGPGCSSLEGFLQENGLFQWTVGQYSAEINPYSWVNLTNMLWVEYPVGVGFSTGKVTATTEEETADDFVSWYKNFLDVMDIKNFKTYVTGESYAGRYVPYVSAALLDQHDKTYFDVGGALMYDPCIGQFEYSANSATAVPYVLENNKYFNFNQSFLDELTLLHNYCGYANYTEFFMAFPPRAQQPAIYNGYRNDTALNCDLWTTVYDTAYSINPCWDVYEVIQQCPMMFDPLGFPTDVLYNYRGNTVYFNRPDVKKAMHAPMDIQWAECSGPVFVGDGGQYGLGDTSLDPIQKVLPQVIEATNRVLVANGDLDFEIITNGTLLSIQNMTWNGMMGFQTQPHKLINITLPDLKYQKAFFESGLFDKKDHEPFDLPWQGVMGIQHYERGLMWAQTALSGHMEPQYQPRSAYRHLEWVLGRTKEL